MSWSKTAVPETVPFRIGVVIVLFVKFCAVVKSAVIEVSIVTSFAFAIRPLPATTFTVTSPLVPPPVRPVPETTLVMSPVGTVAT